MATYQMLWDCTQCGTTKLLGLDHRFCPACGAPQDPEARYFPKDDEKVAVEDHVYAGADRTCANCGTANAAKAAFCVGCGAPMEGGAEVAKRERQAAGDEDSAAEAKKEHRDRKRGAEDARAEPPEEAPEPARGGIGFGVVALILVVLLALCAGIWALTRTESIEVVVAGHHWERTIAIEALKEANGSGWDEDVPGDAREVRCERKERGTEQVEDGQTCRTERVDQGDGTFSEEEKCSPKYRSEPAYDQHCTWVVDRWESVREVASEGGLGQTPEWPATSLRGGERAGAKRSVDEVRFTDAQGGRRSCEVPVEQWPSLPVGSAWTVEAGIVTGGLDCDTLKAK